MNSTKSLDVPSLIPRSRWRSFAFALFLTLIPSVVIGILETTLTLTIHAPTLLELLYGVNIHLMMALLAVFTARVIFWTADSRSFPPIALSMYLLFELALTGSFWIIKSSLAPPLHLTSGKLFAVITLLVMLFLGIALIWITVRRLASQRWVEWMSGWPGIAGTVLFAVILLSNGFFAGRHFVSAREGHSEIRSSRPENLPNVIIILVDTLRKDHLSYFGYPRPTSPNVDRLFKNSFVFNSAYTPSNKTVPSIVSLFTGLYPSSHGILGPFEKIPLELPTLAEHLHSYGYETAAFVANVQVSVRLGFDQGFNTFSPKGMPWCYYHGRTWVEALMNYYFVPQNMGSGSRINREFIEWLNTPTEKPRFAYLHYMEPHSDYAPPADHYNAVANGIPRGPLAPPGLHNYSDDPELVDWQLIDSPPVLTEEEIMGMVAGYDGEIHLVDDYVGQVLKALKNHDMYENTHVIFLTDHGEEFGNHNGWFHGYSIYEELTGSPVAYRPPGGIPEGFVIDRPVNILDVTSTLLDLLELDALPMDQGQPIQELTGELPSRRRIPVISERPPHLYSCRLGPWKLIRRGEAADPIDELYDITADPIEKIDLSTAFPDTLIMLRRILEETIASRERIRLKGVESAVDPETLQRLRSLGYIK